MTTLQDIDFSAADAEVPVNENFETLSAAGIFGKRQPGTAGLTWNYYGGRYNGNTVADGTLALTNTATNYIVVHRTTGVVSVSTADTNYNNTSTYARLYQLTVAGGVVTAIVDGRMDTGGVLNASGGAGLGDVVGPGSAVDDRIATFDGTTGKLLQDGGKTIAELRAPAIQSVASSATVTPTFADDIVLITAQAAGLTLANPTGTAIDGLGIVIRIKDNGTARSIAYGTQYRAIGVTLPTTTVISKTLYLAMIFNSTDTKWDVLAVGQEA